MDCKEIQPVHSEGDQPWDFFGRNDAKAETLVLWPPHEKSCRLEPTGSSVHGILQARTSEWVATPFSRGSYALKNFLGGKTTFVFVLTDDYFCFRKITFCGRGKLVPFNRYRVSVVQDEIVLEIYCTRTCT